MTKIKAILKPGKWTSIKSALAACHANGQEKLFSKETRRFFGSRLGRKLYAGRLFIESVLPPSGCREYGLWLMLDNGTAGRIENENGQAVKLASWQAADKLARDLAACFYSDDAEALEIKQRGQFFYIKFAGMERAAWTACSNRASSADSFAGLYLGNTFANSTPTSREEAEELAFLLCRTSRKEEEAASAAQIEQGVWQAEYLQQRIETTKRLKKAASFYTGAAQHLPVDDKTKRLAAALYADIKEEEAAELAALLDNIE